MKRARLRLVLLTAVLALLPLSAGPAAPGRGVALRPAGALAAVANPITTENAQPGSTGWQFDYDNSATRSRRPTTRSRATPR